MAISFLFSALVDEITKQNKQNLIDFRKTFKENRFFACFV